MKWNPKYKKIEDIMNEIGFISANNGWILKRKKQAGKPVQYHLAPSSQGYDLHADYEIDGNHKIMRNYDRDKLFIEILNCIDRGERPFISDTMRKNYKTLKL